MLNPEDRTSWRIRGTTPELEQAAREMRQNMTPAERVLWDALRSRRLRGLKFRAQHAVGQCVLDFYCPAHRLAIEVDGPIHDDPEQRGHDDARTEHLIACGYRILRFTNDEVLTNRPAVLQRILQACGVSPT